MSGLSLAPANPMNRAVMSVLIFEVIVFCLGIPGMILLDQVRTPVAVSAAVGASLLAVIGAAGLKKSWGYPVAWLAQVAGLALGFLTTMMFAAAGIFVLVWAGSFVLGRKIEQAGTMKQGE